VFFIHVFSVISPAFAERSAEAANQLAQLQAQGPAKTIETVNLAMPSFNVTGLPFYVAVDKGYYLAEGIDLRIVKVQGHILSRHSSRGMFSSPSSAPRRLRRDMAARH
jgi:hypothetical protein